MRRIQQRYVVIDSRSGMAQVVTAGSQKEANTKALTQFRVTGGIATA